MSEASEESAPRSFWERSTLGWHVTFGVVATVVAIGGAASATGVARAVVPALVAVIVAAYVVAGRLALGSDRLPLALGYLVPAWLALLAIVVRADVGYLLLFVLFPQSWAMLPSRRTAVVWNCLTVAALVAVQLEQGGDTGWAVLFGIAQLALTLLLGLWISGIVAESTRRAELLEALQRTRAELAEAERARGVLAERERLAREIHDTLAQGFTSVLTLAQAAEAALDRDPAVAAARLQLLEQTARDNLAEARVLVAALGPVDLSGSTLAEALRRLAGRFSAETGIPVSVEVDPTTGLALSANAEVVLVRAAQEALANVRRHAGAAAVTLRLRRDATGAELVIDDDGRGTAADEASGYGLAGMRARAREVGGAVEVSSRPGVGTTVRVSVP